MTISGVLVLTTAARQDAVVAAVEALNWAEVHHRDARGRFIVTIEASDTYQGQERLKVIKGLRDVLSAELVVHCFEDEPPALSDPAGVVAYLNGTRAPGGGSGGADVDAAPEQEMTRGTFQRLKALGNY